MRKGIVLLAIVPLGAALLAWSPAKSEAAKEAAIYSTSSITFDFAKNRFEWEMLRHATSEEPVQVDSFYVDLNRGVMGHNDQESQISEKMWVSLVKIFEALDNLTINYTRSWFLGEGLQKEVTGGENRL